MKDSEYFSADLDKIVRGLEAAYKKLVVFKKQKHTPLVVSRNGKVVEIPPDKIVPVIKYQRKGSNN